MLRKVFGPLVPLLVALSPFGGGEAQAAHCGACGYPVRSACPEQCGRPEARSRVCSQTVWEDQTRTCSRPVYQPVMREIPYTVGRPVYEQHGREERYTVRKP